MWVSKNILTLHLQKKSTVSQPGNLSRRWVCNDIRVWVNNIEVLRRRLSSVPAPTQEVSKGFTDRLAISIYKGAIRHMMRRTAFNIIRRFVMQNGCTTNSGREATYQYQS